MTKEELMEKADEMRELMGDGMLLDELFRALSADELRDNLEYIDSMNDLDVFN